METIQIFIASSAELKQDRDEFREFLSVLNDRGHEKGVYLQLVQWEYFLDTVSETGKQDDYNQALRKSQIVICLFYTKAGKYTQEEFDTALSQFKETGSPLIYTYFKSGAPAPDPANEQSLSLVNFKKRLEELKHFYTVYNNIDDLKVQFRNQLDVLEEKGFIKYQEQVREETKEAVTNYFNIKNAVVDSTITASGDVHIGDTVANTVNVEGSNNIIIQGVSDESMTLLVDGVSKQIQKKLDVLQQFMEEQSAKSLQAANNTYNIGTITDANFGYVIGQAGHDKSLPSQLAESLVGEGDLWIRSLERELLKQNISVSDQPWDIFQNYDWLIQTFLQKMCTVAGKGKTLRRLSFMAEAYQASLRYLCYIQMAQILQLDNKPRLKIISDFIQMEGNKYLDFDYTSLLLTTTDVLGKEGFMSEVIEFVKELTDTNNDLYGTALFLEDQRHKLMSNSIPEDDKLPGLLDEYLTALVYWLRNISFLANYRLVSIKEINLNYRLGSAKNFVHLYGELHSIYNEDGSEEGDYKSKSIKESFTFNKSILLLRGNVVSTSMNNIRDPKAFVSLSPLVIDQSVYAEKPTQTPEVFYYSGYDKVKRQYKYSQYKNELAFGGKEEIVSNKMLKVIAQNNNQPKLDELYEQLDEVFTPLKSTKP